MYEAHITFERENAAKVEEIGSSIGWKFSKIDGDPVLGQKVFCYLTRHAKDGAQLLLDAMEATTAVGVTVIRVKVEHIVYDTKTGINVLGIEEV